MLNQNSKIKIQEEKTIISSSEFSYGKLFDAITSYQNSFVSQIRDFVESKILIDWEGCSGVNEIGIVTYYKVLTNIFNTAEEPKLYDYIDVDYYNGLIIANIGNSSIRKIKLQLNLSV